MQIPGPYPRGSDSGDLEWALRVCSVHRFPSNADGALPGTTL